MTDEPIIVVPFKASTLDALGRHMYDAPHKIARLVLPELEAAVATHNAIVNAGREQKEESNGPV